MIDIYVITDETGGRVIYRWLVDYILLHSVHSLGDDRVRQQPGFLLHRNHHRQSSVQCVQIADAFHGWPDNLVPTAATLSVPTTAEGGGGHSLCRLKSHKM